jgi:hypothetical protein
MVKLERQDPMEIQERRDLKDQMDPQEKPVFQDHQEPLADLVEMEPKEMLDVVE